MHDRLDKIGREIVHARPRGPAECREISSPGSAMTTAFKLTLHRKTKISTLASLRSGTIDLWHAIHALPA